jgi:hypothetical protein
VHVSRRIKKLDIASLRNFCGKKRKGSLSVFFLGAPRPHRPSSDPHLTCQFFFYLIKKKGKNLLKTRLHLFFPPFSSNSSPKFQNPLKTHPISTAHAHRSSLPTALCTNNSSTPLDRQVLPSNPLANRFKKLLANRFDFPKERNPTKPSF